MENICLAKISCALGESPIFVVGGGGEISCALGESTVFVVGGGVGPPPHTLPQVTPLRVSFFY